MTLLPEGGLLALDWGQKKVGYATCDENATLVTPRGHFKRAKNSPAWKLTEYDRQQIKSLINTWQPGGLVLGLPLGPEGKETPASKKAQDLAKTLESTYSLAVELINESLTSWESRNTKDDDAAAAALLLSDLINQKHRSKRGFTKFLILSVLVVLAIGALLTRSFFFSAHSSRAESSYIIDIAPNTGFPKLFEQLGLSTWNKNTAKIWLKVRRLEGSLKIGEFLVSSNWSVAKTLEHILTQAPLYHTVTVKEGENIFDVFRSLSSIFPSLSYESYRNIVSDPNLLKEAEVPTNINPNLTLEGFLFPETYAYQKYHKPKDIIRHMISQFNEKARPAIAKHEWASTPEGAYKILILASIVEKESSLVDEQPVVASVFWNRIRLKMRLQSDPTTIYPLLPNFDGNLKRIHLETLNDYNTYKIPGLPIAPISNPGLTAIQAVVEPAQTDYLYFVSKNDGSHIFSSDYKTHAKYVRQFQIERRKAKTTSSLSR